MHKGNRLIAMAIGLSALVVYGCQTQDGSVTAEAERPLQTTAVTQAEVNALIDALMDPVLGKSSKKQFASIVADLKKGKTATAQAKAHSLVAFILKHYQDGKWIDPDGLQTGALNLAILQFAGIIDDNLSDATASACLPGNECEATPPSQVESPVVAICSEFTQSFEPGVDVFLWHTHDGVVEPVTPEEVVICDEGPGELSSRWANPLLAAFQPVLRILSPQPLYAVGGKGVNIGGGISNFSVVGSCLPGCIPTTTTVSIVEGGTSFTAGQTITLRAVVDPAPDGGNVLFYATSPVSGPGAPAVVVVDGVATRSFTCGSSRVPFGSHTAQVQYMGTSNFKGSVSNTIAYTCLEG